MHDDNHELLNIEEEKTNNHASIHNKKRSQRKYFETVTCRYLEKKQTDCIYACIYALDCGFIVALIFLQGDSTRSSKHKKKKKRHSIGKSIPNERKIQYFIDLSTKNIYIYVEKTGPNLNFAVCCFFILQRMGKRKNILNVYICVVSRLTRKT
jgi:hypothetical protein